MALLLLAVTAAVPVWLWLRPPEPFAQVSTLAGVGPKIAAENLSDPFGVAIGRDGSIYVSDGRGGKIYRIGKDGQAKQIIAGLDMPSALAVAPDGTLIVANTGAHTILRVDLQGRSATLIAGTPGVSGDSDGAATTAAKLNAPVGVAVSKDGTVLVADTYNDRIRLITKDGQVKTLAGDRAPGFRDGQGAEAQFDTPCGITVATDGSLLVADTGNHRIRRVTMEGMVTTIAGTGEVDERDGAPLAAAFAEPMAIAVRDAHSFYVADAAGNAVRLCDFRMDADHSPVVTTLAGGWPPGLQDGALSQAKLNRPTGLAILSGWVNDALVFADSGNGLVRAFATAGTKHGYRAAPATALLSAAEIRAAVPPRWPYDPPEARREIAGTFGEVRGEIMPEHDAWFHNGLDIPGAYGETARAIYSEQVTRPLAVDDVGSGRERLRLPLFGYIHLRIGRDQNDQPLGGIDGISFVRDAQNHVTRVRVRRGTRINAGDPIGTLNRLNHVHLIAGPTAGEVNALAALSFPGISDTVAPVIESVELRDAAGQLFGTNAKPGPPTISGRVRIIVRAYDQADGNARYRRLGLYQLGYTVLRTDGSPAPGFEQLRANIVFDRLPMTPQSVALAYAEGSQSGYSGQTIFAYTVTNIVRNGEATEDFCDVSRLPPGSYKVRVMAEDFFSNRASRDVLVSVD